MYSAVRHEFYGVRERKERKDGIGGTQVGDRGGLIRCALAFGASIISTF